MGRQKWLHFLLIGPQESTQTPALPGPSLHPWVLRDLSWSPGCQLLQPPSCTNSCSGSRTWHHSPAVLVPCLVSGCPAVAQTPTASPCSQVPPTFCSFLSVDGAWMPPATVPAPCCCCFSSNSPSICEHRGAGAGVWGAAVLSAPACRQGEGPLSGHAVRALQKR